MKTFTVAYDYLCPFARIANESLVDAIAAGGSVRRDVQAILTCTESSG